MSKIYLDSANSKDTTSVKNFLKKNILWGQTTNPSLFANQISKISNSSKFNNKEELWEAYKLEVIEIAKNLQMKEKSSLSIEVYVNQNSTQNDLWDQILNLKELIKITNEMYNCQLLIKIPISTKTLETIEKCLKEKIAINVTLGFTPYQANTILNLANKYPNTLVYFSYFVGRNFDSGVDGIEILKQIKNLIKKNTHTSNFELLACSFRTLEQVQACLALNIDILTISIELLEKVENLNLPNLNLNNLVFTGKKDIKSQSLDYFKSVEGLEKFTNDWDKLIKTQ
jgi:transaldolase